MNICTVCKSKNLQICLEINELVYWKCNFCEAKLLDQKNYISFNEEKKHYLKHNNIINDQGYRDFLSRLTKPLKDKISLNDLGLDYGCGYAPALADILKKDGFSVDLYDPFFFPNNEIFLNKFNFIICSEVIEHFFHPYEEFLKIDSIMQSNAWFGIMTTFMTEDYLFKDWYYRRDPTHVVFYNKKTFNVIADQHNWKVLFPFKNIALFNKI